ncbi:MAG: Ornithine cyclodeaminase [Chloroflexi bacterium]|nr:Ornithine cyclodeaminase [Chloroflexota bacterium]
MLLLTDEDVQRALPLPACMGDAIAALERAEIARALGRTSVHPRASIGYRGDDAVRRNLVVSGAIVDGVGAAVRTYTYGPSISRPAADRSRRLHGVTAVYAFDDMGMVAILEDGHLNNVRTAAPTGLAASHLAIPEASELAMIGTGKIASGQLAAVCAVRPIRRVRVYSRTPENVARFAREMADLLRIEVIGCSSAEEAIEGAHVVLSATTASAPVVHRDWLSPGATVITLSSGEIDEATALDSRIVTTSVRLLRDLKQPREPFATLLDQGRISADNLVEIGEILIGKATGRERPDQLITYASRSSATWDVAVPSLACERARQIGVGTEWP